jgi:hypothetical protein
MSSAQVDGPRPWEDRNWSDWRTHSTPGARAMFRRAYLLDWMQERPQHDGLTAREIADVSGLYDGMTGMQETATKDLRVMGVRGYVTTTAKRGGRWYLTDLGRN